MLGVISAALHNAKEFSCVAIIKHECGSSIVFASRKLLGAMYMTFHVLQLSHGSVVGGSTL